ncbi:MAG TPA: hypothetical protein VKQ71_00245, partial [Acidimicrobiales bacterium]|nr:hypothetical protein [Acidimicrobiales bacterium]
AHIPKGTALLLDGAQPPRWLRLTPWHAITPFARELPSPTPPPPSRRALRRLGRQRGLDVGGP